MKMPLHNGGAGHDLYDAPLLPPALQVEVEDPEKYRFDGECLAKADDMGHPGIVDIQQKQVS